MAKILIPSILVATILIAGAFALLPVQEAVTLHLTGSAAAADTDTVDSAAIVDGTIATVDIAANAITTTEIAANTITGANIAPGGIDAAGDFAAGVVDTTAIAANTITGANIAPGGIDAAGDFAAGVVDSTALADAVSFPTSVTIGGGTAIDKITILSVADGSNGWIPDGGLTRFVVNAGAADIAADSVILISTVGAGTFSCSVSDIVATTSFTVDCSGAILNTAVLNVVIINP